MLDLESAGQVARSLRVCATPGGDCGGCCYEGTPGLCSNRLKKVAAETLELLSAELEKYREEVYG